MSLSQIPSSSRSTFIVNSPTSRSLIAWLLLISDIFGLIIGFNLAFLLRLEQSINWRSPILYILIAVYLFGLYLTDTYRLDKKLSGLWPSERVLFGILATVTAITSCIYLTGLWGSEPIVGRGILLISVGFFSLWAVTWRIITCKWIRVNQQKCRFLVLSNDRQALDFAREYSLDNPQTEFVFLTHKNSEIKSSSQVSSGIFIENIDFLDKWIEQSWSGILIDDANYKPSDSTVRELMEMRLQGVYVYSLADFCEELWQKIPPAYVKDDWFAFTSGFSILHNRINAKLKQLIDVLAAGFLLVITLPITLLVAISIKLDSPGPIFYSQIRTGLNGKKFKVYKFRSMNQNAEQKGIQWAQKKDPRITRVGYILRLTRIDEFPQLWNVLKGDMSLVGPRPERPEFDFDLRKEIPYYDVRYLVKPGITGWAQVRYPYGSSVEDAYQKVAYDLYYIKNYSLFLDAAIAIKTLRVMLLGKGR